MRASDFIAKYALTETVDRALSFCPAIRERLLATAVVANSRLTRTSGRAWSSREMIELNPRLLTLDDNSIRATFLHELAHIMANMRHGKNCGHGAEWWESMFQLGQWPQRCHNYTAVEMEHGRTLRLEDLE